MVKASLVSITKELTAAQQAAHNTNYSNLADKDMEVLGAIPTVVGESLASLSVTDSMIGTRTAIDPMNTSASSGTTFTGNLTAWLSRISSRIISISSQAQGASYSAPMGIMSLGAETDGDVIFFGGEEDRGVGTPHLDGISLGTIHFYNGVLQVPVVTFAPSAQGFVTRFFFFSDGTAVNRKNVFLKVPIAEDVTAVQNISVAMVGGDGGDIHSIDTGVLYAAELSKADGELCVCLRQAEAQDYI